ncbi:MAG: chorismate-binding protein [Armatimonadetes bacterium]|nr:chorismate-binding protein [Armatimonadota bacterium]MCA1995786.1 chorismate-binding protein [Armatimonadota bacterium]
MRLLGFGVSGDAVAWDEARQRWLQFTGPRKELVARSLEECPGVLQAAEQHALRGGWAVGFVAYDSAPSWDPALVALRQEGDSPLAAFALYEREPETFRFLCSHQVAERPDWWAEIDRSRYRQLFRWVQRRLQKGDTYQANLTFRLRTEWNGDLAGWFASIAGPAPPPHAALLNLGGLEIASFSPELFLERTGRTVRSRPMKGTERAGSPEDALRLSEKQRAENLMIVDMVRNDLGRVAQPGAVRVPELFSVERHGEVLQMTSTVEAETDADLCTLFRAAFPCASIVGAPKVETTRILAELEPSPRGVYTGAIGWIEPGGDFRFSVAIRTAVRRRWRYMEYGTGGGIVWDSNPEAEWQEALLKTAILDRESEPFALLETLEWNPERGYPRLGRHLARLERSCRLLGWKADPWSWFDDVRRATREWEDTGTPTRVRLLLHPGGRLEVQHSELQPPPAVLRAKPALRPVRSDDPALRIKTTYRSLYRSRLAEVGDADECLLWNERGEATEFCNGNLVVRRGGRWVTPPVSCGLLPGVLREELLEEGHLTEAPISLDEILNAQEAFRINSLIGWIPVRFDRQ